MNEKSINFGSEQNSEAENSEALRAKREEIVSALREHDPESEQMLFDFILQLESKVGESFSERIEHIRNVALIYIEASLEERALAALEDAAEMAYQEGQDELCRQIEDEMSKL